MKTYKTIFDRMNENENIQNDEEPKAAFDFYKSLKNYTRLNYRDFLAMTNDENKLKIIMIADFLGYDLKYFSGKFSKERLKQTLDFLNKKYIIPKTIANCNNDDIFIMLLKLIKQGVDFNIYSYENYTLYFLKELSALISKKPQNFNINLWHTLEKLFVALNYFDNSLLVLQNNIELIKTFSVNDIKDYAKKHNEAINNSDDKLVTFDIS